MKTSKNKKATSVRFSEMKIANYPRFFDSYLKSQYEQDKLFKTSLLFNNKPISLISYFNILFTQKADSLSYINAKLLIFTSPPFSGVNLVINNIKEHYPIYQVSSTLFTRQINDSLGKAFSLCSSGEQRKVRFVLIDNYPLKLSKASKNYMEDFDEFKKILLCQLNSQENPNVIFILYWTDYCESLYIIEKLLGKEIVQHESAHIIELKKISLIKIKSMIKAMCNEMRCPISKDQIDKIAENEGGNLVRLKQAISDFIKFKSSNNGINKEEKFDNYVFHLLGKLLYNKRIDPIDNQIKAMNKLQLSVYPQPQLYFTHQEIIDSISIDLEQFNFLLIEGAYDHFVDISELAEVTNCFSYTNTFNKFKIKMKEREFEEINTMSNMKMCLNALAVTTFNLSQYNNGKNQFKKIRKSNYNHNQTFDEEFFYECISYNPTVACFNKKNFESEIGYVYRRLAKWLNKSKKGKDKMLSQFDNENDALERIKEKYKRQTSYREDYNENISEHIEKTNEGHKRIIDKSYNGEEIANIVNELENDCSDIQCEIDESEEDEDKEIDINYDDLF